MSATHRLPTLADVNIPIHPAESIYETTTTKHGSAVITHETVREVLCRPQWSIDEATLRFYRSKKSGKVSATARPRPTKRAPKKSTPQEGSPVKQIAYVLIGADGAVRANIYTAETSGVSLEPWMLHGLTRGWRLERVQTSAPDITVHGWVDWKSIADSLASALSALISPETDTEGQVEVALEQAASAIDAYTLGLMEVSVAQPDPEEPDDVVDADVVDDDGQA